MTDFAHLKQTKPKTSDPAPKIAKTEPILPRTSSGASFNFEISSEVISSSKYFRMPFLVFNILLMQIFN